MSSSLESVEIQNDARYCFPTFQHNFKIFFEQQRIDSIEKPNICAVMLNSLRLIEDSNRKKCEALQITQTKFNGY